MQIFYLSLPTMMPIHHQRDIRFYAFATGVTMAGVALVLIVPLLPRFPDSEHLSWLLTKLPYILIPLAGFLALRVNVSEAFVTSVFWALSYALLRHGAAINISPESMRAIMSVGLPLSTTPVAVWGNSNGSRRLWLLSTVSAMVFVTAIGLGYLETNGWFPKLFYPAYTPHSWWHVPFLGTITSIGCGLVLLFAKSAKASRFFAHALAGCFVIILPTLNYSGAPAVLDTFGTGFCLCGSLFIYSVYRTYWEKIYVDDLTNVLNRRALNERMYRLGRHYSIAMVDLDYFKTFNDTHGHAQGDTALKFVASQLDKAFPNHVFRYGGEEFCIILDNTPLRLAARRIESVRHLVHSRDFYIRMPEPARRHTTPADRGGAVGGRTCVHINFSAGVAYSGGIGNLDPENVLQRADKALYAAKRSGRGRVMSYEEKT